MKDKKRIEILLTTIENVYTKNLGMQKVIVEPMINICREEGVT